MNSATKVISPRLVATVLLFSAFLIPSVQAQFAEINMSAQVDSDFRAWAGTDFPLGGTQLNIAGVPFGLAELDNNPNSLGICGPIDSGGSSSLGPFDYTFPVPAGTYATALYTLMNTTYGVAGVNEGNVVVTGTLGETATLTLTEGSNIRDYNNGYFCNTLTDPTVVSTFFQNGAPTTNGYVQSRLDRQQLILPSTFSGDTIASISFQGDRQGYPDGSAFLAGLTLANIPEPSTWSLLALGAVALFGGCRMRRR